MIANPTHIAIGIYFKPHLSPIPLISVRVTNEVALGVRKYAKEIGIPIITDKKLARKIYATHRRYDYVSFENIDEILRLLLCLKMWRMLDNLFQMNSSLQKINSLKVKRKKSRIKTII